MRAADNRHLQFMAEIWWNNKILYPNKNHHKLQTNSDEKFSSLDMYMGLSPEGPMILCLQGKGGSTRVSQEREYRHTHHSLRHTINNPYSLAKIVSWTPESKDCGYTISKVITHNPYTRWSLHLPFPYNGGTMQISRPEKV